MFLKYALGQQSAVLVRALQELFIRILFTPNQLALWNLITVIANAMALFQANLVGASNRLLAQRVGAKASQEELKSLRGNSLYLEFAQQTLLSIVLLIIAPLIWEAPEDYGFLIYLCAAALMVSTALVNLLVGLHESSFFFARLGILLPLNALLQAVFVYVGATLAGILGLVVGAILGVAAGVICLLISLHLSTLYWRSQVDVKVSRDIAYTAYSFRLADIPTSVFYMLDAIVASIWLPPVELAIYMTAKFAANFSSQAVFAANRVNLISLGNTIGAEHSKESISYNLSKQFSFIYLLLLPGSIAIAGPFFRFGIPEFLPNYTDSLSVLPFLLIGTLFSARSLFLRNLWIQSKHWSGIALSGVGGLVVSFAAIIIGRDFFTVLDSRSLAILVLVGQLPYAIGLIIAVSKTQCATKHMLFRLAAFFVSMCGVTACLWMNGSIEGTPLHSVLYMTRAVGAGAMTLIPFVLAGYLLRRLVFMSFAH